MAPEFICPTVPIKIGERVFNLRMDMNALTLAEKLSGCNFLDPDTWDRINVTAGTALFWACAAQTDGKLTIGDIRGLAPKYLADVVDGCRLAWRAVNDIPAEEPRPISESTQKKEAVPAQ